MPNEFDRAGDKATGNRIFFRVGRGDEFGDREEDFEDETAARAAYASAVDTLGTDRACLSRIEVLASWEPAEGE